MLINSLGKINVPLRVVMFILPLVAQGQGTRGTYINLTLGVQDFRGVHLGGNTLLRVPFCGCTNLAIGFRVVLSNRSNGPYQFQAKLSAAAA